MLEGARMALQGILPPRGKSRPWPPSCGCWDSIWSHIWDCQTPYPFSNAVLCALDLIGVSKVVSHLISGLCFFHFSTVNFLYNLNRMEARSEKCDFCLCEKWIASFTSHWKANDENLFLLTEEAGMISHWKFNDDILFCWPRKCSFRLTRINLHPRFACVYKGSGDFVSYWEFNAGIYLSFVFCLTSRLSDGIHLTLTRELLRLS